MSELDEVAQPDEVGFAQRIPIRETQAEADDNRDERQEDQANQGERKKREGPVVLDNQVVRHMAPAATGRPPYPDFHPAQFRDTCHSASGGSQGGLPPCDPPCEFVGGGLAAVLLLRLAEE